MSSEDQFTSVQWDRGEIDNVDHESERPHTITEEESNSDGGGGGQPSYENEAESSLPPPPTISNIAIEQPNHIIDVKHTSNTVAGDEDEGNVTPDEAQASAEETALFNKYAIETSVSAPIRDLDSSSKPYISYLVVTTTNHANILKLSSQKLSNPDDYLTMKVRRRYGDFNLLHECLSNDYPTALIPPIPSKSNFKYLTGDTFSSEFVNRRLHSLDRFIKFILLHKRLSQSPMFHLFISDSNDWANFAKNLKVKDIEDSNNGFVNKVVNEELFTETVMNFFTPGKHKKETNKDILEISDKLKKIYENLIKLDKMFVKLNKKNHDLSTDYEQFSNQILKLTLVQQSELGSTSEPTTPIKQITSSTEDITSNFKIFADSLNYFSTNWANLYKYVDDTFLVALKDCAKYILSLNNLIELLHNKKIDQQMLHVYLNNARSDLAGLGASSTSGGGSGNHHPPPNPVSFSHSANAGIVNSTTQLIKDTLSTSATAHIGSTATENKILKLQMRVTQLEDEISASTKVVNELTSRIINEEYPNWDKFNRNELKNSMVGLCDEQISFYKGLVDNWGGLESKLLKRLDDLK
ncbi:hypothetical protein DFJ63DRAFT_316303 [Scheffersomyces coipomensis]|uniref:uncharacterized protein n=1 Tax=Scheffersomyces coipomensis TaxID=1788519 RepID=UPI00315CB84E